MERCYFGFNYECDQKTRLFNNLISFVALKIDKYKMLCTLESLDETEYNLRNYVKKVYYFLDKCFKI